MPTHNQSQFIGRAIQSFRAQDLRAELVVVDDGSTDGTANLLSSIHGLRVVRHAENRGTAEAINTGVRELGPGFDALTWISSDNDMAPHWLSTLARELGRGAGAAYGGFNYVFPPEKKRRNFYCYREHTRDGLLEDPNCYYGPAFLVRADAWQPHRGRCAHDYDNWLRVEEECYRRGLRIVGNNQPLCNYLAHDLRVTVTRQGVPGEFDAAYWQQVARERRAAEKKGVPA